MSNLIINANREASNGNLGKKESISKLWVAVLAKLLE